MRHALVITLALLLAACGGTTSRRPAKIAKVRLPPADPAAVREFDAAMRAIDLGGPDAHDKAESRLERAVALDARLWEAWHDLGAMRFLDGDDDGAIEAFGKALAINPGNASTFVARAEAYRRAGELGKARKDYAQAISQSPNDASLYARSASLLRERGDYEDALDTLREALRVTGATSDIYVELGLVYLAQGRDELAELVLSKAAALDDKNPAIYNAMALVLLARGKDQEAFERFYQATALDPNFLDARFNVASVFIDSGDYAKAVDELERVVNARPGDLAAKVALGVAYRGAGQLDRARREWDDVVKAAPKRSRVRGDALYNLAVLEADFVRDDKKAVAAMDRFLQESSKNHPKRKDAAERRKELGQ